MFVVGMISGTSADGIETAVVELNGAPPRLDWKLVAHIHVPFDQKLRNKIFAAFRPETGTVDFLCRLNFELGEAFAHAARAAIDAAHLKPSDVSLIGSHGQTVWHDPPTRDTPGATLQIGSGAVIAERTGITTISNLRARDVAAGGHGAPVVSFLDWLFFRHPTRSRAIQNLGGIGNVTFLPPLNLAKVGTEPSQGPPPIAFDTGPSNMLIDYCASRATNGALEFDRNGEIAARGRVDQKLLDELMTESYLHLPPPKTTGRELFGVQFGARLWDRAKELNLSDPDIVATATAFTAESVVQAYRDFLPARVDEIFLAGGGAHNPTLVAMIRERVAPAQIHPHEELGLAPSAKEAVTFAVLAYETFHNRSGNVPSCTGARHAVVMGDITPGANLAKVSESSQGSESLTEANNPATADIDALPTLEMLRRINAEDARVTGAVANELPRLAAIVDAVAARMRRGGRLIYVGAGTSGRLGVLDAAEMPPTFSAESDQVIGLIAGGERAITRAVEGAEDDPNAGARDLRALDLSERDSVIGISASGRAPYVLGAMKEARARGAFVASIACNRPVPVEENAEVSIALLVGPEVIAGSTRMKAGTAQKMALNMISTGVMIQLGKTYGNLMVDLQATNAKLRDRARRIVAEACNITREDADALIAQCGGEVKTAIVVSRARVSPDEARQRLSEANGSVRRALGKM